MGSKYGVGYHGPKCGRDLQGVATLTHDPIAIENVRKVVEDVEEIRHNIIELTGVPKEAFEKDIE